MSVTKHTPEPWHYPGLGEIHAENHDEIAQILYHHEDDDGYCGTDDDAERIVTCVNACAGIDNDDLRKVTYAELLESHQVLETQLADATRKLEEASKENHNLNWALGAEGYDRMATPEEQAEHEEAVANCTALITGFAERKAKHDAMGKDAERYRWLVEHIEEVEINHYTHVTKLGERTHRVSYRWTILPEESDNLPDLIDYAIEQGN
jgi:hypothetical protein